MERLERLPVLITGLLLGLVAVATANLTGLGIGSLPLLYDPIALPRLAIAFVLTPLAWASWLVVARRRGDSIRVDPVWALVAALAVWSVISMAFSAHRALAVFGQSERLEGAVTVVLYALLYGLGLQVVRGIKDVRVLVTVLSGAAVLLSAYGITQYAGFDPFDYSFEGYAFEAHRAFATFGNPTFLAGLLVLALPMTGAIALTERSQARRIAWGLGAVLVAAALFATFSRGAWLGMAVQIPLGALIIWRARANLNWSGVRPLVVIGALVATALVLVSVGASAEINLVDRLTGAFERTGSARERTYVAEAAVEAAAANPLVGSGPDTFLPTFRLHRPDDYVVAFSTTGTINRAHSWPLQYAATLGVPGAVLLVSAVILALIRSARAALPRRRRGAAVGGVSELSRSGILLPAVWVGCVGFSVHMLTGVAVPGAVVPFWVLLGVLGAPHSRAFGLSAGYSRAFLTATIVLTVAGLGIAALLVMSNVRYLASRNAYHGLGDGDALALAQSARTLNPLSIKYARGAAQVSADRVYTAIEQGADAATVRAAYEAALPEFEVVFLRDENDYPGLAWLAALQARCGVYLNDETLLMESRFTAQRAAVLDRQNEEVFGLIIGDTSDKSIFAAYAVLPLP